jgi:fatty-acyl-CoA synthase
MNADLSIWSATERRARLAPTAPTLIGDDDAVTDAAALARQVLRTAAALHRAGTGAGDRVAWLGRNDPGLLITLLAAQHLGAVFVPTSFRATPEELTRTLAHCDPVAVVVQRGFAAAADQVRAPGVRSWLTWPLTGADPGEPPPRRPADPDDLTLLMSTSGSSGRPKAVMLSHANLWWSTHGLEQALDLRADDVTLAVAPLCHIGGLNGFTLGTLARGGAVRIRAAFDPQQCLDDLTSGAVTSVFGVPAMYAAVARCPGFARADLSAVRAAIVGGAPTTRSLIDRFLRQGMRLHASWGMTEIAPAGTIVADPDRPVRSCCVGTPLPDLELRLVDPATGQTLLDPDLRGEILVRGPQVTRGYWRDPAATRSAIRNGWLHTGDLATRDQAGDLVMTGRLSEVINSGGEKIDPGEVEAALGDLDVAELVVVGLPDQTWGEVVVLVVRCDRAEPPTLAEVRELAGARIARHKLPKHLVALAELPRTAAGKIDRYAVRKLAAAALSPEASEPDPPCPAGAG